MIIAIYTAIAQKGTEWRIPITVNRVIQDSDTQLQWTVLRTNDTPRKMQTK